MQKQLAPRVIGTYGQDEEGPLVIAIGGIHGNEPAGVMALERVLAKLHQDQLPLQGRLLGLRGNLQALAAHERYLHQDLNRLWTEAHIQTAEDIRAQHQPLGHEQAELLGLLHTLRQWDQGEARPKILLDLHTTSAPGGRFSVVEDDAISLQLAATFHAPVIMGLTKALIGTTSSYCVNRGWHGLAFEAGQHRDPRAIDDHAAALWTLLQALGCLPPEQLAYAQACADHLEEAANHLPSLVEVVYRHVITAADAFRMRPGYVNFQPVAQGEWLADDRHGQVLAPSAGLILMPLYQPQGADGFFIVQARPVAATQPLG
jgi:succinylglutamate desuccinylase